MTKNMDQDIYKIIENNWPINISGIARKMGIHDEKDARKSIARIKYHIKKLEDQEKIITKKIDRATVIWPHDIEKLRFVHEFLK
jgi:predicted transcriptional regulator